MSSLSSALAEVNQQIMRQIFKIALLILAIISSSLSAEAQLHRRSPKQMVKGGMLQQPDTLATRSGDQLIASKIDSLLESGWVDSLRLIAKDSLELDSLISVSRAKLDSIYRAELQDSTLMQRLDSLAIMGDSLLSQELLDSLGRMDSVMVYESKSDSLPKRKGWLMSDSMSLSKVCWASAILPGYGQIYNKQYWKLPILYGLVGTGIGLYIHETNKYKPLKREWDEITSISTSRTPELDALQREMIRHNTLRQTYLIATVASYLYFIGDAAINYRTNDVSSVKKATTLACICPGAGQIYNKSYWKVPFVVGGFAAMVYCIDWNNRGYQRFKKAYSLKAAYDKAVDDYNANPDAVEKPTGSTDEFRGRYSADFLKNLRDNYRRNRDLCIIITAGLYVLQIVDAHVDAHLKDYDISDDLSMDIEPKIDYTYMPNEGGHRPVFGFNLNLNF